MALSSTVILADVLSASKIHISGDARVKGISISGITNNGAKVHTRIVDNNNQLGNNGDDTFTFDEASIIVPLPESFLYIGRLNDTYGTKFYSTHNHKIDLVFYGYTGVKDTLLYFFDFKAVEGNNSSISGNYGLSTDNGDYDAYGMQGQVNINKLLVDDRYVSLQNNTTASDDSANSFFGDAFVSG